jgi:PAS domain S-box-containing protein
MDHTDIHEKTKEALLHDLSELRSKHDAVLRLYEDKIEESRLTEFMLRENEANIKAIIENSLDSVWSIDLNYNIQYINKVFATSFYQTFGVLLKKGVNLLHSIPPHLRAAWKERYDRVLRNEHFVITDKIDHGNSSTYIEVAMYPIVFDGKVSGASFFGKDITERMRTEEALLESKTRFKALHNASFGGIAIHDKGTILECNQGLSTMTGYSYEELIGMDGFLLFSEASRDFVKSKVLSGEEKPYEAVAKRKNGEEFPARLEARNVPYKGKLVRTTEFRDITEQKKAEETLKNSEERLKILFDYAPEAYFMIDLNGVILDGNIAAEKLFGYLKSELVSKSFFDLNILPQEYLLKAANLLSVSEIGKATVPDEFVLIKKDGSMVTTEITIYPIQMNGQTTILGMARDVSARKKAEKEMQMAFDNWNRTFQAMHNGIALLDANQKILQTNIAFKDFLNSSEPELIGKPFYDVFQMTMFSEKENLVDLMKKSKARKKSEIEVNGRVCEIIIDPILGDDKEITGAVLVMNDITQRKRDENIQQILHEITGFHMLDKSLSQLLSIVRKELGKVLDATNFFVALYQPETDTLRKVIFEDEKDDFVEWEASKSLSGQVVKLGKPLLLNSEDEALFAAENNIELLGSPAACWLGVPLMSGEKAIGVMVVQSYTDENAYDTAASRLLILVAHELSVIIERNIMIEDLVAAKDRAEESDRLKSAFLANMSHEIRTPMNGILGFAELLKQPKLTGEEQQMFVEIIEKSGERMLNIINDLINISKIESGQMDILYSDTNINEQLDYLFNFFKLEAKQKDLKLIVSHPLPKIESEISTDKEKLYAILTNLIKNALKFTKEGSIEFGYKVDGNQLVFFVKDTGIGVPENKRESIFERFVQANSGMSSVYEGAGLGLSISKAYVEMLGGKIWVESKQGAGTCFYFTLPLKLESQSTVELTSEKEAVVIVADARATILIAEDDETSMFYLKHILKKCKVEILEAKTGGEAVEMCRNHQQIELVLMDINMPVIDGYMAAQIIKGFRPGLPIIAQTAFALVQEREKYMDTFDDYVTKPIKADELKLKMGKMLNRIGL